MRSEQDIERILQGLRDIGIPPNSLMRAKNAVMASVRADTARRHYILERSSFINLLIPKLRFKYMIAALILALVMGGGGTVAAAQNDLPGEALYGVKLASERVAERLSVAPEARGKLGARFAQRRAEELDELKARVRAKAKAEGKTEAEVAPKFEEHMARTTEHMTAQIERAREHLVALKAKDTEGALRAAAVLE